MTYSPSIIPTINFESPNEEISLQRTAEFMLQLALVYPTTSVPHNMCRINKVLDKSG